MDKLKLLRTLHSLAEATEAIAVALQEEIRTRPIGLRGEGGLGFYALSPDLEDVTEELHVLAKELGKLYDKEIEERAKVYEQST